MTDGISNAYQFVVIKHLRLFFHIKITHVMEFLKKLAEKTFVHSFNNKLKIV